MDYRWPTSYGYVIYLPNLRELESRSNERPFGGDEGCCTLRALHDSALVACVLNVRIALTARARERVGVLMQGA